MNQIIAFFERNREQVFDFISGIHVNRDKTKIRFGYIEGDGLNLIFYIPNEPDLTITRYEDKINCLFHAEIEDLDDLIGHLKTDRDCEIHFTPYLKVSDSPVVHAFQMNVSYTK